MQKLQSEMRCSILWLAYPTKRVPPVYLKLVLLNTSSSCHFLELIGSATQWRKARSLNKKRSSFEIFSVIFVHVCSEPSFFRHSLVGLYYGFNVLSYLLYTKELVPLSVCIANLCKVVKRLEPVRVTLTCKHRKWKINWKEITKFNKRVEEFHRTTNADRCYRFPTAVVGFRPDLTEWGGCHAIIMAVERLHSRCK